MQKTRRADVPLELVAALLAATVAVFLSTMAVRTAGTPTVRFIPNTARAAAPATQRLAGRCRGAGFTGRLGAVAPQVAPYSYGQWATTAEAAGYTGRLGGATAQAGPMTSGQWLERYGSALAAAKVLRPAGRRSAPATSSTPDSGGVNFTEKLKAGRA